MFSGLTSYIFGASAPAQEEEVTAVTSDLDDHPDEAKLRLRTSPEDSEWVLVDKAGGKSLSLLIYTTLV